MQKNPYSGFEMRELPHLDNEVKIAQYKMRGYFRAMTASDKILF